MDRSEAKWIGLICGGLTLAVAAGQVFRLPGEVRDLVTGSFPQDVFLSYPAVYAGFAPFFQAADHLTILSLSQHGIWIVFANLIWVGIRLLIRKGAAVSGPGWMREALFWLGFNAAGALIYAAVVLIPRPMAALRARDPDWLIFDAHSHTRHSWDANRLFTPARNLLWHARGGFDAAFITDHNVFSGVEEALRAGVPGIAALRGEEVSLYRSHWVLLGARERLDNSLFDGEYGKIRDYLARVSASTSMITIASLPEYWKYHSDHLEELAGWGARGFEIANSAPLALDFPESFRRRIVDLCRENHLVMTGVSDAHGWGFTVYVWNLSEVPGWRALSRDELEVRLLRHLKEEGDQAVRVVARVKAEPVEGFLGLACDPFRQLVTGLRTLPPLQAGTTLAWIWLGGGAIAGWRRRRRRNDGL